MQLTNNGGLWDLGIQEEDQFANVDIRSAVDRLLSLPFEAAMETSEELRRYAAQLKPVEAALFVLKSGFGDLCFRAGRCFPCVQSEVRNPKRSKDEIADLEAEFAQSWSLEAPSDLRDVLAARSRRETQCLRVLITPRRKEEVLFPDIVAARQAQEARQPMSMSRL